MQYMTRHMEALRPFQHEGRDLRAGDIFVATEVDAGYLARHGKAREVTVEETAPELPQEEAAPPRRRGRPTNAEREARLASVQPPEPEPADPYHE